MDAVDPWFPGPLIGPYMEFRVAVTTALERILIEGRPVDRALEEADTDFESALDEYARDVN